MAHFFNPIIVLQVLKNLEMAPGNRGSASEAFKDVPEFPDGNHEAYSTFLSDNDLIAFETTQTHKIIVITSKGRVLLRQAEILIFSADKNSL
jgi:hypothetical protein